MKQTELKNVIYLIINQLLPIYNKHNQRNKNTLEILGIVIQIVSGKLVKYYET